jgi:hypothetical protein
MPPSPKLPRLVSQSYLLDTQAHILSHQAKKSRPRKKKVVEASTSEVSLHPRPAAAEVSRSTEDSSDEESDADDSDDDAHVEKDSDSDASEVDEEPEEKPVKKAKKATNHVAQTHKSKKGSTK